MRKWILRGGMILLGGTLLGVLLWALSGYGHNPNHDINMDRAREAARRVHTPPNPSVHGTTKPDIGG